MKVGIIGSGIVGQTLAKAFLAEGHEVMIGTRNVYKEEAILFKEEHSNIMIGEFKACANFGELLVLTVVGTAVESVIKLAGAKNFAGKVVIDTTNPIAPEKPEGGVLKSFTTQDESLMEKTQKLLPHAFMVKAFNTVGSNLMYKPALSIKPTMFIAGDDAGAKKTVTDILTIFGWETEDMGGSIAARPIESLSILWCIPGFLRNEWGHAFKLIKQ
ncbi:NADPH-dependent F420 reductase [Chitinophagaceae bacterium LWZ2-11]